MLHLGTHWKQEGRGRSGGLGGSRRARGGGGRVDIESSDEEGPA